jgi:hypothetical protein
MMMKLIALVALGAVASAEDFVCPGDYGFYANPDNCIKYYQCTAGEAMPITCGLQTETGEQLCYDEINIWCEVPSNVNCGDRPICDVNDQNCYEPTPVPTIDPDIFTCPEDNGYFPDERNCIKYYHCLEGVADRETCPDDVGQLYWDPNEDYCDFPENVNCGSRPICDGNDENCYEPTAAPTIDPDIFTCPAANGDFADERNCIKYYHCLNSVAESLTCADGGIQLQWDTTEDYCDYPENVDCGLRPICDENDENCSLEPTTAPNECDAVEDACDSGAFVPLGPCESCYCQCVTGEEAVMGCCGENLFWDPNLNVCNFPEQIEGCSAK